MSNEETILYILRKVVKIVDKTIGNKRPAENHSNEFAEDIKDVLECLEKKQRIEDGEEEEEEEEDEEQEKKTKQEEDKKKEEQKKWNERYTERRELTGEEMATIKKDVEAELAVFEANMEQKYKTASKRHDMIKNLIKDKFPCKGHVNINPAVRSKYTPAQTESVLVIAAYCLIDPSILPSGDVNSFGRLGIIYVAMTKFKAEFAKRSPLSSWINKGEEVYKSMISDIVTGIVFIKSSKPADPIESTPAPGEQEEPEEPREENETEDKE